MVGARICSVLLLSLCLIKTLIASPPSEGKEIADRFGDDLSFASKQIIRGFTAIFAPIIDTVQTSRHGFAKIIPLSIGGGDSGMNEAAENFRRVLLRDGVNALGKGVKAGATIISTPARVAGTGLEEARKVGEAAGINSKIGSDRPHKKSHAPPGSMQAGLEDGAKVASTLLNTTASEFSQANLGAVLVEVALKNRIKDIGNKTATAVQRMAGPKVEMKEIDKREDPEVSKNEEPPAPSRVDPLLERFNEAVKQNDDRVMNALRDILKQINPPKN